MALAKILLTPAFGRPSARHFGSEGCGGSFSIFPFSFGTPSRSLETSPSQKPAVTFPQAVIPFPKPVASFRPASVPWRKVTVTFGKVAVHGRKVTVTFPPETAVFPHFPQKPPFFAVLSQISHPGGGWMRLRATAGQRTRSGSPPGRAGKSGPDWQPAPPFRSPNFGRS
jgi:hypothetical protein